MLKKILLGLLLLILVPGLWFHAVGKGWLGGEPWSPAPVEEGPRPQGAVDTTPRILFGDLHTHTNYSFDAYVFNSPLMKDVGVVTPADACDFARYCASLDFWSINDHAEGLTPRVWADTVESIRQCNAQAGDPANPDLVSFVGWEWSNSARDNAPSHYGHKNVIFRTWEEGRTPARPIASAGSYPLTRIPAFAWGLMTLVDDLGAVSDLGWYVNESVDTPVCPDGIDTKALPASCREVAPTPADLYRKLDEWGFDSLVIPHGLAWGTTNPLDADFRYQLGTFEQRYERLIENYSGHGNSERFEGFRRGGPDAGGVPVCPEPTDNFTPCCRRAGELARQACAGDDPAECDRAAEQAMQLFAARGAPGGRKLFPEATLDDWAGCGQLRNSFQPASMYVPRQSTQYNLALGFDADGAPQRVKVGLIGSSDNHLARPGNSYKETDRRLYTDSKQFSGEPTWSYSEDRESGSFFYTGGLVAVHSDGRHRDAIWDALHRREVYATSGDRMLVWFDLLNGPDGEAPMGAEVTLGETPRFRVKALGAFEQQPGCPDYAVAGLGGERIESLCGGECYLPGDRRRAITRVEVVRIRPQSTPDEDMAALIEHRWRVFDCPADGAGCTVEFTDPEYVQSGRSTLYYARVIQEAEALIGGDPFGCEYDARGNCIRRNYCIGENAAAGDQCRSPAEPRAWTSPIFLEYPAD